MAFIAADGTVCPTKEIKFWYEAHHGIKSPEREMPDDAICVNNHAFLTEDEKNWYLNPFDTDDDVMVMAKIPSNSQYPLSLVAKWGFSIINEKRYEELEREYCISQGWDYDKMIAGEYDDDDES